MMKRTLGLLFYLKSGKSDRNEERFIYLRITIEGKSTEISTKRKWALNRWNSGSGRASGSKEHAGTLNMLIDTLTQKAHEARRKLIEAGKKVSSEMIRKVLLGTDEEKRMVIDIFQHHNDQMSKLVGQE